MKFLFQNNLLNEKWLARTRAIAQQYPSVLVECVPFERTFVNDQDVPGVDYIPYGSVNMMNICVKRSYTGVAFNNNFAYDVYAKNTEVLNDGQVYKIEEAMSFFEQNNDSHWFCKPNKDDKKFDGSVEHAERHRRMLEEFHRHKDTIGTYGVDDDFEVIISKPVDIQMEVRWFVVGGKVIDGSMYRHKGTLHKENVLNEPGMLKEAQAFADIWLPHDNVVMDLALVDNQLKVVEFNAINSSGFYDHNPELIFKALWEYYANT